MKLSKRNKKIIYMSVFISCAYMAGKVLRVNRPTLTSPPQKTNNKYKDYAKLTYQEKS